MPDREDTKVWEAISRKLRKYWPTSRNTDITEQMFKLSVTEVCKINTKYNIEQSNTLLIINFIRGNLLFYFRNFTNIDQNNVFKTSNTDNTTVA